MVSVVIAAHNEAAVIGRCLDTLLADGTADLDVTVVANGCTDDTAAVAHARGVRVLDLPQPGKAGALNAGDAAAVGFPRLYLDADIPLSGATVRTLAAALAPADGTTTAGPLAVVPRRRLDLSGRPLLVRAYYAVHSRLPVFRDALFGRGAIMLSAAGRARFDRFPEVIADDLFLDAQFASHEKREVPQVESVVATPLRTRDLVRRLARVRAGNAALRAALGPGEPVPPDPGGPARPGGGVRPASRWSWLRDVVLPRPWLAPAAVCYVTITVTAALLAKRRATTWGRDESSRIATG